VDFTREPIIETIITPREGYRLVVRSSKTLQQEEHFVEAVEMVSFGGACFFRSLSPRPFIVPCGDYEIIELRQSRMMLKTPSYEGQGRASGPARQRTYREPVLRERDMGESEKEEILNLLEKEEVPMPERPLREERVVAAEARADKRKDRRRGLRRKRDVQEESVQGENMQGSDMRGSDMQGEIRQELVMQEPVQGVSRPEGYVETAVISGAEGVQPLQQPSSTPRAVLPPPTTLIRDELQKLRESDTYRGAFFLREEKGGGLDDDNDASLEPIVSHETIPSKPEEASSSEEEHFLLAQPIETEIPGNSSRDLP